MRVDGGGVVGSVLAAQRLGPERRMEAAREQAAIPAAELRLWNAPQPPAQASPTQSTRETARTADVAQVSPARLPPDARVLALLAQDVYADKAAPPAGWRAASPSDLHRLGIRADMLENASSGFRARVYVEGSGADARYVVAFRGTQGRGDWISNGQQVLGQQSDHYRRALQIGRQLARTDGLAIHITGHSLGGGLASACGLAGGVDATTFQAAGLSDATVAAANAIRAGEGGSAAPHIRAYHVRGEILSAIQDGGDRVAGGLIGFWLGGLGGGALGAATVDAPPAYGERITLEAVRPAGVHWWQDNPVARHGMDWVLASL